MNRNTSAPAAMEVGTAFDRGIGIVKPAIVVASVTTSPLKPSLPRSRSPMISGASVAGMMSASACSGRSAREYAGCMMWPTITVMAPASIDALYAAPYVASHSSTDLSLMLVTRCWSRSSQPSPGKCLIEAATP